MPIIKATRKLFFWHW